MFVIDTNHKLLAYKYRDVYGAVIGRKFPTLEQAQGFLSDNGWRPDPFGSGEWVKDGPTRMCGQIGVSMVHYVFVRGE